MQGDFHYQSVIPFKFESSYVSLHAVLDFNEPRAINFVMLQANTRRNVTSTTAKERYTS